MSKILCTKMLPMVEGSRDIEGILCLIPRDIKMYLYHNSNGCWLQSEFLNDDKYNICKELLGDLLYIPSEQLSYSYGIAISDVGLNIRSKADENSSISSVLDFGQRFKISGETGDWYHIELPIEGYIYKPYTQVSETPKIPSNKLIEFTASWEGFSATPYKDAGGNWTVGFGDCTYEERPSSVTFEEALNRLKNTLNNLGNKIYEVFKNDNLTQYEFDSLVDFAYNLGFSALIGSDLVNDFRECYDNSVIESDFKVWSYCNGKQLKGLVRRRIAEYEMFLFNGYKNN